MPTDNQREYWRKFIRGTFIGGGNKTIKDRNIIQIVPGKNLRMTTDCQIMTNNENDTHKQIGILSPIVQRYIEYIDIDTKRLESL